jgi:hypothetical protein
VTEEAHGRRWTRASFEIATPAGPAKVVGMTYAGLGFAFYSGGWGVVHLNSGHEVCRVRTAVHSILMDVVDALADAGDWTFTSLKGFENLDPAFPEKVNQAIAPYRGYIVSIPTGHNDEAAREIAERRE